MMILAKSQTRERQTKVYGTTPLLLLSQTPWMRRTRIEKSPIRERQTSMPQTSLRTPSKNSFGRTSQTSGTMLHDVMPWQKLS
eukprot:scaffold16800_cov41-Attheya_sp.AAC.5